MLLGKSTGEIDAVESPGVGAVVGRRPSDEGLGEKEQGDDEEDT